jgi:hypothetical protein
MATSNTTLDNLALKLAKESCICAVESASISVHRDGSDWRDVSRAIRGAGARHLTEAIGYLEQRGQLIRHPRNKFLVSLA